MHIPGLEHTSHFLRKGIAGFWGGRVSKNELGSGSRVDLRSDRSQMMGVAKTRWGRGDSTKSPIETWRRCNDFRNSGIAHPLAAPFDPTVFKLPLDLIPWKLVALKCGSVCVKDESGGVQVLTTHRAEGVGPTGDGVNAM